MKFIISFFCLLAAFLTSYSQEKILFLNGKELGVSKVIGIQDNNLIYQSHKDTSQKSISVNRVFSVTNKIGQEKVLYRKDSLLDYNLTPDQMKMFITGEQEAMKTYQNPLAFAVGGASGVAGGLLIPFFATLSLIPPATGALLVNISVPNVSRQNLSDRTYQDNPDFIAGYQLKARSKKLKTACLGAGVGLFATFTVLFITGSLK